MSDENKNTTSKEAEESLLEMAELEYNRYLGDDEPEDVIEDVEETVQPEVEEKVEKEVEGNNKFFGNSSYYVLSVVIGFVLGIVFGILTNSVGFFILFGVVLGVGVGYSLCRKKNKPAKKK